MEYTAPQIPVTLDTVIHFRRELIALRLTLATSALADETERAEILKEIAALGAVVDLLLQLHTGPHPVLDRR